MHVCNLKSSIMFQGESLKAIPLKWGKRSGCPLTFHLSESFKWCRQVRTCVYVQCSVAQSRLTLYNPMYCSLPDSSVHGIFLARILEWVSTSSSKGIFLTPGSNSHLLHLLHCGWILYFWATRKPQVRTRRSKKWKVGAKNKLLFTS